jgi:DNA-binding transcriptional LysR family regulator
MTSVTMEWENRFGRRLRVRDLYILSTVVKAGSMGKAARTLGISQPAVSEAVANLEHLLGVRLLDRSPRGIEPTIYADAILKRTMTVFDELKQGVRDIRSLADPTAGEVSIGYSNMIAATVVPKIIERFSAKYPRVVMHVDLVQPPTAKYLQGLRDRTFDLILARLPMPLGENHLEDELNIQLEFLFDDPLVVVVGARSRWARRRKVDLKELIDEPWILSRTKSLSYERVAEAFKARGLGVPSTRLVTYSMDLRAKLVASGRFVTVVPQSVLQLDDGGTALKMLPVDLPTKRWPVMILTLKNRTISPTAERFISCAHEVAKLLVGKPEHTTPRRQPNVA